MPENAQIEQYVTGLEFPVDKDTLIEHVRSEGADEDIIAQLEEWPDDSFESLEDVSMCFEEAEVEA